MFVVSWIKSVVLGIDKMNLTTICADVSTAAGDVDIKS